MPLLRIHVIFLTIFPCSRSSLRFNFHQASIFFHTLSLSLSLFFSHDPIYKTPRRHFVWCCTDVRLWIQRRYESVILKIEFEAVKQIHAYICMRFTFCETSILLQSKSFQFVIYRQSNFFMIREILLKKSTKKKKQKIERKGKAKRKKFES